jgi:uncharacterized protein (TIGR02246 family)
MSEPLRATASQPHDKAAIRNLVDTWRAAIMAGDIATLLSLMTDDVVFMVPGREPFGKEAFPAVSDAMKNARMEAAPTSASCACWGSGFTSGIISR